jgi:hypothetical protein
MEQEAIGRHCSISSILIGSVDEVSLDARPIALADQIHTGVAVGAAAVLPIVHHAALGVVHEEPPWLSQACCHDHMLGEAKVGGGP